MNKIYLLKLSCYRVAAQFTIESEELRQKNILRIFEHGTRTPQCQQTVIRLTATLSEGYTQISKYSLK